MKRRGGFAARQHARTRWHVKKAGNLPPPPPGKADDALAEANRIIAEARARRDAAKKP